LYVLVTHSQVHQGDWLRLAPTLSRASVDFLYADLPFNTGKTRKGTTRGRGGERAAYADSWPTAAAYVAWLRERLIATIPALKPAALVALHVDYRVCHHVRLLLDDLLGADRFVNHLIWSYGLGGSSPRAFARKHDDILLYCIDPKRYWFEAPRVAATSQRLKGKTKKATDVIEIPSLNNMARERSGYPTQKPLELLELLVAACCPKDGLVLDPTCGSGTTLVAAQRLGRRCVGVDVGQAAVELARHRLAHPSSDDSPSRDREGAGGVLRGHG
jgi:DNA modification methylase